jgi:hypothetical protein
VAEIFALLLLVAAVGLWIAGMRARDAAVDAARRACDAEGVQLLDYTVALALLRLQRRAGGPLALRRVYRFEFSDTGNNRLHGSVTLLGTEIQALYLEPHLGRPAARLRPV